MVGPIDNFSLVAGALSCGVHIALCAGTLCVVSLLIGIGGLWEARYLAVWWRCGVDLGWVCCARYRQVLYDDTVDWTPFYERVFTY